MFAIHGTHKTYYVICSENVTYIQIRYNAIKTVAFKNNVALPEYYENKLPSSSIEHRS